jgi:ABC-type transport system involved in Fe-S cluster assembly fused permease/ATPase subunit
MTTESQMQERANSSQGVRSENLKPNSALGENPRLSTAAVEFREVSFSYDDEKVLDGISFAVMRGKVGSSIRSRFMTMSLTDCMSSPAFQGRDQIADWSSRSDD